MITSAGARVGLSGVELSAVLVQIMGVGVGRQRRALGDPDPLAVGTSSLRAFEQQRRGRNAEVPAHPLRRAVLARGEHVAVPAGGLGRRRCRGVAPGLWGGEARDAATCCTGRCSQRGVTRSWRGMLPDAVASSRVWLYECRSMRIQK